MSLPTEHHHHHLNRDHGGRENSFPPSFLPSTGQQRWNGTSKPHHYTVGYTKTPLRKDTRTTQNDERGQRVHPRVPTIPRQQPSSVLLTADIALSFLGASDSGPLSSSASLWFPPSGASCLYSSSRSALSSYQYTMTKGGGFHGCKPCTAAAFYGAFDIPSRKTDMVTRGGRIGGAGAMDRACASRRVSISNRCNNYCCRGCDAGDSSYRRSMRERGADPCAPPPPTVADRSLPSCR